MCDSDLTPAHGRVYQRPLPSLVHLTRVSWLPTGALSPDTIALDVDSPARISRWLESRQPACPSGHHWPCVSPLFPHNTQPLKPSIPTPSKPTTPLTPGPHGPSGFSGRTHFSPWFSWRSVLPCCPKCTSKRKPLSRLADQQFSKCGLWTSRRSITGKLVRHAGYLASS